MIQSAFGEDLQIPNQEWIKRTGHAIECRICAEDPITMLPAPGLVTGCETNFPQGIRFDNCLYKGLNVTPDFDPMVGKLVAKGIIREVAIRKMRAALDGLLIEGLKTNIPLHKVIMNEESFNAGKYSTAYIGTIKPQEKIKTEMDYTSIYKKIAGVEARRMGL
jgi:acetyl-CoA carboxylase biotin carboxylase subunit